MRDTLALALVLVLVVGLLVASTAPAVNGAGLLHPTISTAYYDARDNDYPHKIGVPGIGTKVKFTGLDFEAAEEKVAAIGHDKQWRKHSDDVTYMEDLRKDLEAKGSKKSYASNEQLAEVSKIMKALDMCDIKSGSATYTSYVGATEHQFISWLYLVPDVDNSFKRDYNEDKHTIGLQKTNISVHIQNIPLGRSQAVHRISAIDCDPDKSMFWTFDEAGFVRSYSASVDDQNRLILREADTSVGTVSPIDLSRIGLNETSDTKLAKELIIKDDPNGLQRIQDHYDHSFIESITIADDHSLCYTRGLRLPGRPLVTCINSQDDRTSNERDIVILSALEFSAKNIKHEDYSILAMEAVNTSVGADAPRLIHHFVYLEFTNMGAGGGVDSKLKYRFCPKLQSYELFSDQDGCEAREINVAPIDLVHYQAAECEALLAFYPQMYEVFGADQSLLGQVRQPLRVVKWMDFVPNAILHWEGKFYFFLSGNGLKIAKPTNHPCDSSPLELGAIQEYRASEFLLQLGALHSAGVSYKSAGHTFTGYSVFDGKKWTNDIKADETRFKTGELIRLKPVFVIDDNGTTPDRVPSTITPPLTTTTPVGVPSTLPPSLNATTPSGPSNGTDPGVSKPGPGMSLVMIFICLFIVLGIISALIYYFFFSGPADEGRDMGLRKAKSAFRQHKSKRQVSGQPLQSAASSAAGAGAAASRQSAISHHKTVRSAMSPGQKSTVKSAIKAQSSGSKLQSPGSKQRSPKSPKSLKSLKSPIKSQDSGSKLQSPGSKQKSPGSKLKSPSSASKSPKSATKSPK